MHHSASKCGVTNFTQFSAAPYVKTSVAPVKSMLHWHKIGVTEQRIWPFIQSLNILARAFWNYELCLSAVECTSYCYSQWLVNINAYKLVKEIFADVFIVHADLCSSCRMTFKKIPRSLRPRAKLSL